MPRSLPVWVSELEYDLHKCGTVQGGLYALVDVNELRKMARLLYDLEKAIEHEETLTHHKHRLPLKYLVDSILEISSDSQVQTSKEEEQGAPTPRRTVEVSPQQVQCSL